MTTMTISQRIESERTASAAIERRIDELLARMTLEEKTGQMLHVWLLSDIPNPGDPSSFPPDFPSINMERLTSIMNRGHGIGFMLNDVSLSPRRWFEFMTDLHREYMSRSRLKIPFIHAVCHQHGAGFVHDSTIFPHNLTLAATFDPSHAKAMAEVTVLESADLGHNFVYVPVMDIGRNPRWSRFYETFGESYELCARMGEAIVRGVQEAPEIAPFRVSACAKHFVGYSDPRSGWDRCPAHIPAQELHEFYIPPFKACIDAGVKIIEVNSGEVNGIPAHASHWIMTELLRDHLGFTGVLNSDACDIKRLFEVHRVAHDEKEATFLAIAAGIDCVLTTHDGLFAQYACELVREGRLTEERIDLSVRRILRLKFDLGLFDTTLPLRNDRFDRVRRPDSMRRNLEAARESVVLLKNDNGLLPITCPPQGRIVVAGPNAHRKNNLAGAWTEGWQASGEQNMPGWVKTVLDAMCELHGDQLVAHADSAARIAELAQTDTAAIVYVAGEEPYAEMLGSINDFDLPDPQLAEIEVALSTGKPVVLVMVAGRPRTITRVYNRCAAVVWAGLPGYCGGQAIAEVIGGVVNPSGKLPFNYPATSSRFVPYNMKFNELAMNKSPDMPWAIAEFGAGLSYTTFVYSDLRLDSDTVEGQQGTAVATVTVTNTGAREGREAVLWYIFDEFASITRPVRELKHFEKIGLQPGESRVCTFTIEAMKHLSFPDENGRRLLEPGTFVVSVANQSCRFAWR